MHSLGAIETTVMRTTSKITAKETLTSPQPEAGVLVPAPGSLHGRFLPYGLECAVLAYLTLSDLRNLIEAFKEAASPVQAESRFRIILCARAFLLPRLSSSSAMAKVYKDALEYHEKIALLSQNLILAARRSDLNAVNDLLRLGANVNAHDHDGLTALMWGVWNGRVEVVELILAVGGIDITATDNLGRTALMCAALWGHVEVVNVLLANDASITATDNDLGRTALTWAAQRGRVAVVDRLLELDGIDVNATDYLGCTALMWAASNGHVAVVERLLAVNGIHVNPADNFGRTALMYADASGHSGISDLLKATIDQNLIFAASNGDLKKVNALLIQGARVNATDDRGKTAAFWAGISGHYSVLRRLKTPTEKILYPAVMFASLGSMAAAVVLLTPGLPIDLIVCASVFALLLNEISHMKHYGCSFIDSTFGVSS